VRRAIVAAALAALSAVGAAVPMGIIWDRPSAQTVQAGVIWDGTTAPACGACWQ
jgi:hypothetical protein